MRHLLGAECVYEILQIRIHYEGFECPRFELQNNPASKAGFSKRDNELPITLLGLPIAHRVMH